MEINVRRWLPESVVRSDSLNFYNYNKEASHTYAMNLHYGYSLLQSSIQRPVLHVVGPLPQVSE